MWTQPVVLVLLVYPLMGAMIYANSIQAPFHFDDKPNIVENPYLRITDLDLYTLMQVLESPNAHRPVALMSFAMNYYIGGADIVGYHVVNVTIHIVAAILLYCVVKTTILVWSQHPAYARHRIASNRESIAFFAGLVWLVHPLHTQSVTYILQRMNSMAAMFFLLSLLCYAKARMIQRMPVKRSRGSRLRSAVSGPLPWFVGCGATAVLALGSKEIAATLPFFLLLYEWYFFHDVEWRWMRRKVAWVIGAGMAFIGVSVTYMGSDILEDIWSMYDQRHFTPYERVLTEFRVVMHYLGLLFYPHPARLHLDYDYPVSHSLLDPMTTLPSLGMTVALLALAVYLARRKHALISFCILWFFGHLAIESTILGIELVFEHRTYLPSMMVVAMGVMLAFQYVRRPWIVFGSLTMMVVVCATWTVQRNTVWADEIVFWRHEVDMAGTKARPHNNLGNVLMRRGRVDKAIPHLRQAVALGPAFVAGHYNLAIALERHGNATEAMTHYRKVLELNAQHAGAHNNLGNLLDAHGMTHAAIAHYDAAIRYRPRYAEAHYNLALTLASVGRTDEAQAHFQEVRKLKPNVMRTDHVPPVPRRSDGTQESVPEAAQQAFLHGSRLAMEEKFAEALTQYREAVRLYPDFVKARSNLAMLLHRNGEINEAISHYRETLRLAPGIAELHNNLGYILYTQGRHDEAVIHYREAVRLKPDFIQARRNLERAVEKK